MIDIKLASDAIANADKDEGIGNVAFRGGDSLVKTVIVGDGSVGRKHYSVDIRIIAKRSIEEARDTAIVKHNADVGGIDHLKRPAFRHPHRQNIGGIQETSGDVELSG